MYYFDFCTEQDVDIFVIEAFNELTPDQKCLLNKKDDGVYKYILTLLL